MKQLRVTIGERELWLVQEPDGSVVLCLPTVRRADGRGAPGLVTPSPMVLREGQIVTLILYPTRGERGECRGCRETKVAVDVITGKGTWPWPKDHVFEHNHGPKEAEQ